MPEKIPTNPVSAFLPLVYVFDGTFEGLLCTVYASYYGERPFRICSEKDYEKSFLERSRYIGTDSEKYQKVYNAIASKISPQSLENAFSAYLSELPGIHNHIYRYLRLGFKMGSEVDSLLTDESVLAVHKASRRVHSECNRMMGIIRFSYFSGSTDDKAAEMETGSIAGREGYTARDDNQVDNGIYYAPLEPDCNLLPLLAPHFVRRFPGQNWILHDVKRGIAAVYNQKEWVLADWKKSSAEVQYYLSENSTNGINGFDETHSAVSENTSQASSGNSFTDCRISYEELWKQFTRSIAVPERSNLKLQQQHLPKKYWKHITEMQGK